MNSVFLNGLWISFQLWFGQCCTVAAPQYGTEDLFNSSWIYMEKSMLKDKVKLYRVMMVPLPVETLH